MATLANKIRLSSIILAVALLVCSPASAQRSSATPCALDSKIDTSRLAVYVDWAHHFCFRYPTSYARIPHPKPMCRGPKLEDKKADANIGVCVLDEEFRPAAVVRMAPTGIESPPKPLRIGKTGGCGVSPDGYYFNLRGKILVIDFDGPYENDEANGAKGTGKFPRILSDQLLRWVSLT